MNGLAGSLQEPSGAEVFLKNKQFSIFRYFN